MIDVNKSSATRKIDVDSAPHKTVGADVALRSLDHLQQIEREPPGFGKKLRAAVTAALLGIALLGAVNSAQAQTTTSMALPQTAGLFLDHQPTGPPDYSKVLGTQVSTGTQNRAAVDVQTARALDVFSTRLTQIFQHDAGSLAQGLRPLQPGATLNATQQKDIERAVADLLKSVPVGALSPALQQTLQAAFAAAGDHRDLSTMRLGDLGKAGGDAVSALIKDFKAEHPAAFWSLAGVGASAAVAIGYTQGTAALEKLGIKPEVSTSIFKDVKLQLGVQAGPRFADPRFNVGLEGKHTFEGGSVLKGGVQAQLQGKQVVGGNVHGAFSTTSGLQLDGRVGLDGKGKPFEARLSASQTFVHDVGGGGSGQVFANANWADGSNGTQAQSSLSAGLVATHGRWSTSVSGGYDLKSDTFTSSLSTGRTFDVYGKDDLDLQVRGSVNSRGNSSVGVGMTLRW